MMRRDQRARVAELDDRGAVGALDHLRRQRARRRAEREVRDRLSTVASVCLNVLAPRGKWLAVDEAFGGGQGKDEKPSSVPEPAWVGLAES